MKTPMSAPPFERTRDFWSTHEASLNWLALGLLLAAWNASDNDAGRVLTPRPADLRGYAAVSVRAALRAHSDRSAQP